jgi:hypothetical protein
MHVAYMRGKRNMVYTRVGCENMKKIYNLADLVLERLGVGSSGSELG